MLVIFLTTSISGLVFYDAAIKVHEKKIIITNFSKDVEIVANGANYALEIFDILELTHSSLDEFKLSFNDENISFSDFDLKHEKVFVTISSLDICYAQSELSKSGKFESLKMLASENNVVRVKDRDYHVKTLVDLSKGQNYNYKYILPFRCDLSDEKALIEINQFVNYDPVEQREILNENLELIETTGDLEQLNNLIK